MASKLDRSVLAAVLVAALGYFVDVYDLILFSVLRLASLKELGLTPEQITSSGVFILNMQMIGMLLGGFLWGVLGDRKGRLSVLFGSILLYSVASLANGFVHSVEAYAALRFIAGVGLAGELGAGITLVSEMLPAHSRGYSTTIVATVGLLGGVTAGLLGDALYWRTSYIVGGVLGLVLLILRISVHESGMFRAVRERDVRRGDLSMLFSSRERFVRYVSTVFVGVPTWYVFGILILLSPEVGKALGMAEAPSAGRANVFAYIGLVVGDLASGLLSQLMKSRKKVLAIFLSMTAIFTALYLSSNAPSLPYFYGICVLLGFAVGYWAVYLTASAEQFGTNLRATVATTAPNVVRGSTVLITIAFTQLKPVAGVLGSAAIVGAACFVISFMFLARLKETFARDLDFVETDS
jgi:MFS transporter, putative metabolite:H+ symporter